MVVVTGHHGLLTFISPTNIYYILYEIYILQGAPKKAVLVFRVQNVI